MSPESEGKPSAPVPRALRTAGLFLLGLVAGPVVLTLLSLFPFREFPGSNPSSWWSWSGFFTVPLGLLYGPLFALLVGRWVRAPSRDATPLPTAAEPLLPVRGRWARYLLAPALFTAGFAIIYGLLLAGSLYGGGTSLIAALFILWFLLLVFTAITCSLRP